MDPHHARSASSPRLRLASATLVVATVPAVVLGTMTPGTAAGLAPTAVHTAASSSPTVYSMWSAVKTHHSKHLSGREVGTRFRLATASTVACSA